MGAAVSGTGRRQFQRMRFHDPDAFVRLTLSYDLDQTANRDAYRLALLARDKAVRDFQLFADNVRLEVRQSYRTLLRTSRTFETQQLNVQVAKRRSKLTNIERREGEASARDVLESEDSLRNASNGLTRALVTYTTTRLEFLAAMGLIDVSETGQIQERAEPMRFDRVARRYTYVSKEQ